MKNLKNEGDSPLILQRDPRRIIPKPLETRQITLDSPCAKCGESSGRLGAGRQPRESSLLCGKCGSFVKWLSASEVKRIEKSVLVNGNPLVSGGLFMLTVNQRGGGES
jgi:hypothetical protein